MSQNRRGPGRPKSPRRRYTEGGNEVGVALTQQDKTRLLMIERWHTLSAAHLARIELDPDLWREEDTDAYVSRIRGVRRRLSGLARVEESGNNRTGPLVGTMLHGDERFTTYWATKYGGTAAQMPWRGRDGVVWHQVERRWIAADIARQLESDGYRVASQREIVSGTTYDRLALPHQFSSRAQTGNIEPDKTPDLAVLGGSGDFIAVTIVTEAHPKPAVIAETLNAFRGNTSARRLWVVVTSETAAKQAATAVMQSNAEGFARVRIAKQYNPRHWGIPTPDEDLARDIDALRPFQPLTAAQKRLRRPGGPLEPPWAVTQAAGGPSGGSGVRPEVGTGIPAAEAPQRVPPG